MSKVRNIPLQVFMEKFMEGVPRGRSREYHRVLLYVENSEFSGIASYPASQKDINQGLNHAIGSALAKAIETRDVRQVIAVERMVEYLKGKAKDAMEIIEGLDSSKREEYNTVNAELNARLAGSIMEEGIQPDATKHSTKH